MRVLSSFRTVISPAVAVVLVVLAQAPGRSSTESPESLQASAAPPIATANDNRRPAGVMTDGTLTLRLDVGMTRWQPDGETGATRLVQAFSVEGQAPEIPGPLVRVLPFGQPVEWRVRHVCFTDIRVVLGASCLVLRANQHEALSTEN